MWCNVAVTVKRSVEANPVSVSEPTGAAVGSRLWQTSFAVLNARTTCPVESVGMPLTTMVCTGVLGETGTATTPTQVCVSAQVAVTLAETITGVGELFVVPSPSSP